MATTYSQVCCKDAEGTLVLSADQLSLQPSNGATSFAIKWSEVAKHQVSPTSHAKALLKIVLKNGKALTFRFTMRQELEKCRKDVTARLKPAAASKKRTHASLTAGTTSVAKLASTDFGEMDPTALAVTRSTILAANPTLREQHRYLVVETKTVSEEDFWKTHQSLVEEEYAKICGTTRAGTSSLLQSHLPLQGRVTLGVEEMRQIFILYPAVHKAYEEKVPLELSDEQFWRKYLESEFFHRDRGRLGTTARNLGGKEVKSSSGKSKEEEDARAAAVGADDLFGRYEDKLKKKANGGGDNGASKKSKKWGTHLAVGQFDLASTFETERGQLLEGPRDYHPPNASDDGKGEKVISKYNRHWAMVMHPDEAVAGSDLMDVARNNTKPEANVDAKEAQAHGGVTQEMKRLVKYASAEDANQIQGMTGIDDDDYEELNLSNVENYFISTRRKQQVTNETEEEAAKRRAVFAQGMAAKMKSFAAASSSSGNNGQPRFPPPKLGRELLSRLTERLVANAQTDEDASRLVDQLDEDFKKNLHTYFRRSSELLRHFYGLRNVQGKKAQNSQKLARIVQGLEAVYREMEAVRKGLPQNEQGEIMRKMCLPIMAQLDWAFQLYRGESSGSGGTGGFVPVEEL